MESGPASISKTTILMKAVQKRATSAEWRRQFNTTTLTKQPVTPAPIEWGHASHIGRRTANEDSVYVATDSNDSDRGWLFAVADGMGGQPGGGIAGRLACDGLSGYYQHPLTGRLGWDARRLKRHLEETVLRIDRQIRKYAHGDPALADMGTTLSCLVLTPQHAIIAHVGDSRIYRLRRGHLTGLTMDHTFVQDMINEGEVDPARAETHPLRHLLTRAVGTGETLEWIDTRIDPLFENDRFLLCSDGLTKILSTGQIARALCEHGHARQIAVNLVSRALQAGAKDNVTALVVKNGIYGCN